MSGQVIEYQFAISAIVLLAALLFGEKPMLIVALGAVLWTCFKVFTGWLFVFQFATIIASVYVGMRIHTSSIYKKLRFFSWGAIVLAVVGALSIAGYYRFVAPEPIYQGSYGSDSEYKSAHADSTNQPLDGRARRNEMDGLIVTLEARYPQLNPESADYDEILVNKVLARQKQLVESHGILPDVALEQAATGVMKTYYDNRYTVSKWCVPKSGARHIPPCKPGESVLYTNGGNGE